ncbi:hypothetical protein [Oceanobacter kriegii]|uniref:hypothetical protein n=1 Tax=Oceanobacter kriegii TaxID=64972 RepID=UPI00041D420A|nr:hypothetical protein [Oceanobacter kriegii]
MDPFTKAVPSRPATVKETQEQVDYSLKKDEQLVKLAHSRALTGDVKANTNLKIGLSMFICLLISGWFVGLFWFIGSYFSQMQTLAEPVPSSVMLGIIGAGSGVIALMGYILKGLFKSN